jgi:NADH-quinone oxidoreductase subunit G
MPILTINNKEVSVPEGITLIQACEIAGVEIPRFCYHERLEIAGNCRMCLVEVHGGPPKPVASCAMPATDGMKVSTDSPMVKKAREGVMEFLLANHPLDCPICDQAGECDLQDQSLAYGGADSRFHEYKRAVKDKEMGPLVKTSMNRCIHCTRCVRFITNVAGVEELGAIGRGENMEIITYLEKSLTSELSGNVIDLCPVGALTSKPYAFKARSWELTKTESIDVMDSTCSNIRIDSRGLEVMRILPRLNEEINEEWISDKTRFACDGLKYQRLDKSYIKKEGKLTAVTIEEAYKFIANKLAILKGNEIAALTGDLSGAEEVLALKLLMEKLGSNNIDCRQIGSKINASDRASYVFNTTIAGIEQADSCLLIGVNPRVTAPVLNARIRKRYLTNNLKIASIGCDADLTYPYLNLGDSVEALKSILDGKSEYCQILEKSVNPMLVIASDIVSGKDGEVILNYAKKIAEKYRMIGADWNGFNMLHKTAALVGALDVGFVSENEHINTDVILEKAKKGHIKAIYLLGVDNIDLRRLKDSDCFVIYQGSHGENGANFADVILPGSAYTEKDAIYTNTEGRPQSTKRAIFAPGDAKEDYKLIDELAKVMNINLGFNNLDELRQILAKTNPFFANLDVVPKNKWIDAPGLNNLGEFSNSTINAANNDFYSSNIIARTSKTMAKCLSGIKNVEK